MGSIVDAAPAFVKVYAFVAAVVLFVFFAFALLMAASGGRRAFAGVVAGSAFYAVALVGLAAVWPLTFAWAFFAIAATFIAASRKGK